MIRCYTLCRCEKIDEETQKSIDKAVIKSLFKMLYKEDLVDKVEYDRLLECTDKKFEDINYVNSMGKKSKEKNDSNFFNNKPYYSLK